MPTGDAWQTFGSVAGVIIFLGGLVFALKRLGIIRAPGAPAAASASAAPPKPETSALEERVGALEKDLSTLRLRMAEHYISREDWVPMASRVIGMLEQHTALLARLDERSQWQQRD